MACAGEKTGDVTMEGSFAVMLGQPAEGDPDESAAVVCTADIAPRMFNRPQHLSRNNRSGRAPYLHEDVRGLCEFWRSRKKSNIDATLGRFVFDRRHISTVVSWSG